MDTLSMYAVNLKERLAESGVSTEELAAHFELNPDHVNKVVRGYRPVAFWFAAECAQIVGPIKVRRPDGPVFVLAPAESENDDPRNRRDLIPDDEELHDLNDTEHNLNVLNQAEDVVRAMQRLVSSPLMLRSDSELSDALRIDKYKELYELDWAIRGRIREGEQNHPHLVEEGLRRALEERPGYTKESDDSEAA